MCNHRKRPGRPPGLAQWSVPVSGAGTGKPGHTCLSGTHADSPVDCPRRELCARPVPALDTGEFRRSRNHAICAGLGGWPGCGLARRPLPQNRPKPKPKPPQHKKTLAAKTARVFRLPIPLRKAARTKLHQRLLNCLRRRALWKPVFLRSTSRASRVTRPAWDSAGFSVAS